MAILKPYTFNGTSILTGTSTDYKGEIPRSFSPLQAKTKAIYTKRAGTFPILAGKDFQPFNIVLEIEAIHDYMTVFESLNTLFDTKDETPRQLVIQNTQDSSAENPKRYYVYATPTDVSGGHDGPMATVTLATDDPIWQSVTQNSQTFSTTSSTDSTSVTNNGNDYAYPLFEITPSTQPSTDYLYCLYLQVLPQATVPWSNRFIDIVGSTDTTFDTAALVAAGKMQADGDDLRVFRDGVEVDRWLDSINTTDTHVIVRANLPARRNMTLKTALASTDTITEIELNYTTANKNAITLCPDAGRLILDTSIGSTDSEEFTYTDRTITDTKLAFTIDTRAVRNTVALNHAVNDNVRFLPFDFTIVYGNSSVTAPVTDDTRQPQPSLTSRNNSFQYDSTSGFADNDGLRPNRWRQTSRTVSDPNLSRSNYFTSTDDAGDTDPATAAGLAAYTFESGGIWRADSIRMGWVGYFPDLVSSVSASGQLSQSSASWPSIALQASADNITYTNLWTISAQSATDYSTWTTWTKASSDATIPANTKYLRFLQSGTILGTTDYYAKVDMTSVTVGLTNYPHVMLRTENNAHKTDITITNETSGESMRIIYPMVPSTTLYIDTDPEFPTAKYNGLIVNGAVFISSTRSAWLRLSPGANTISYQTNLSVATDISIVIKWRDRLNFM